MRTHVIPWESVAPARVIHDDLLLQMGRPLESQADELKEDLFMAEFPNGCALRVGWFPSFDPTGSFGIALNQNPDAWKPFLRGECRTIAELSAFVAKFVEVARARKERYVL